MLLKIACVGKIKDRYLSELIDGCAKEINRHGHLEICEVPDESIPKKTNDNLNMQIIRKESERLGKAIGGRDYVIALCIDGKKTDVYGLANLINNAKERGFSAVTFVIGGSLGLSDDIKKRADYSLSISDMTFPHQLIRAALVEQLMLTATVGHN